MKNVNLGQVSSRQIFYLEIRSYLLELIKIALNTYAQTKDQKFKDQAQGIAQDLQTFKAKYGR